MVQVSFPLTNLPTSTIYVTIGLIETETHKGCIVGARRDDITGWERAQIAWQCWAAGPRDGTRQRLAQANQITRRTIYNIEQKAREVLPEALEPGPHGPTLRCSTVEVTREHLIRSVLVLYESGVSERDTQYCLQQMLGVQPALGWVSERLGELARQATQVNTQWRPSIGESLAGDEIYSQGHPNLLVVGNDSLFIYALTRQPSRDGDTWACVLWDTPDTDQFARDGGTGLAAGAKMADKPDQLDWWHVLRDLWRIDSSLERRAYGALSELFDREVKFEQAHTTKRLEQHLAKWEKLNQKAEQAMTAYDTFHPLARQVDDLFAMIELRTGQLRDPQEIANRLRVLGKQVHTLGGRACKALGITLSNQADTLCAYLPRLAQALAPLQTRWDVKAIAALCRLWQVEEDLRRKRLSLREKCALNSIWDDSLDTAASLLRDDFFAVWDALEAILGQNWRGSNAAECVNSLLRPHMNARKYTDQNALELLRFLHNVHIFQRGKRADSSPAQLVGIELPEDPFTLLGLPPWQTRSGQNARPTRANKTALEAIPLDCPQPVTPFDSSNSIDVCLLLFLIISLQTMVIAGES
jgi:hypothetical protein